jgi:hypothetical protein
MFMTCGSTPALTAWILEGVKVIGTSPLIALPVDQRLKLVVLHVESAKLCASVGGESAKVFTKLTQEDWNEILPLSDWEKASRSAYSEKVRIKAIGPDTEWAEPDN